jgi:hypothetical protein
METYIPERTYNYQHLIRDVVIFICMIAGIYAIALWWMPDRISSFTWIVPAVLLLKDIFDKTSRDRLQQLTFDANSKEIVVFYKSMFSEIKQKTVSFDQARLEVVASKPSKLKIFEPITLYLLKGKVELFEISRSKDGISLDVLKAIIEKVIENRIPIIRK